VKKSHFASYYQRLGGRKIVKKNEEVQKPGIFADAIPDTEIFQSHARVHDCQ
jgi:hypothetical protein